MGLETTTGVTECREIGASEEKGPRAGQGREDRRYGAPGSLARVELMQGHPWAPWS